MERCPRPPADPRPRASAPRCRRPPCPSSSCARALNAAAGRSQQPVAEIEQVHALVDELAAAGELGPGAPLALVAEPPAMPIAGAEVHQVAVSSAGQLGEGASDRRMEAVVEADLDESPRGGCRVCDLVGLARRRRRASRPARGRRRRAREGGVAASASWVVATMTTSRPALKRSSSRATASAPVRSANAADWAGSMSKQPTT